MNAGKIIFCNVSFLRNPGIWIFAKYTCTRIQFRTLEEYAWSKGKTYTVDKVKKYLPHFITSKTRGYLKVGKYSISIFTKLNLFFLVKSFFFFFCNIKCILRKCESFSNLLLICQYNLKLDHSTSTNKFISYFIS